jgi:uncharacterized membrane protein
MSATDTRPAAGAEASAGRAALVLGVALAMFFDGIVLHQVLQWHRMISSTSWAGDRVAGVDATLLADGLFHLAALLVAAAGVALLWAATREASRRPAWGELVGGLLVGAGAFNLVEGVVDHHLLGLHHVREDGATRAWDLGFLGVSAALVAVGLVLRRARGERWAAGRRGAPRP